MHTNLLLLPDGNKVWVKKYVFFLELHFYRAILTYLKTQSNEIAAVRTMFDVVSREHLKVVLLFRDLE